MSLHRFAILLCLSIYAPSTSASAQSAKRILAENQFHFDGLDLAPDGYLYFAGSWKGAEVFRAIPGGALEPYATGFDGPTDTVMDSKGNLFVSNYNGTSISIVKADQANRPRIATQFATTPLGPAGMAIDENDNIFVTIFGTPQGDNNKILKVTPQGQVSTYLDHPALFGSVGLAIDDKAALYISAGRDGRIFKSTAPGQIELFSCLPSARGKGPGTHLEWAAGELFATSGTGAVFRITPTGALHYVIQAGSQKTQSGPNVSPHIEGSNGITATPDGQTLFVGCIENNHRTLVEIDRRPQPTPQLAWAAFNSGDFTKANQLFTTLAQNPNAPGGVWLALGFLRFKEQNYEQAATHFARAAQTKALAPNALYNQACAHAQQGQLENSLKALTAAINAGYNNKPHQENDPHLAPLRNSPHWKKLPRQ